MTSPRDDHDPPRSPALRALATTRLRRFLEEASVADILLVVLPLVLLVGAAFWVTARFVKPAPPDVVVMSTGPQDGAYHRFAERYREILARDGIRLELRPSRGSVENLQRLVDGASGIDVALMQAGVGHKSPGDGLVTLGAVYYEPLWIMHRGPPEANRLHALAGERIAIGPEGSGTRALALQLLGAARADLPPTTLLPLSGGAAAQALADGRVHAVFAVGAPDAAQVRALLAAPGAHLMSLVNAEAYARHFPYLSVLRLPRGVVDIAADVPPQPVDVLADTATLIAREDLHPALAFLLLRAAKEVHHEAGMLQRRGEFPADRASPFPLSEEASRYYRSGEPFLQRYLPFWVANLIGRLLVLLVPLVAVAIPVLRVLPALLEWRMRSRVFRWYGELKFLEADVASTSDVGRTEEFLDRLDAIERGVNATPVPTSYADYVYHLRAHIEVVRRNIERTQTATAEGNEAASEGTQAPAA